MCLLTYFPPGAQVDASALTCGTENNPHGHGLAVVTPMGIIVEKTMTDPTGLVARFLELREQFPDTDALFHSRITTHGDTVLANCHPFFVAGMGDTVLAHNGVLPSECYPRIGDPRSDTRILAESYMRAQFIALDKPRTRERMEQWLGRGSKVLVLTTNPKYKKSAYLFNEKLGDWVRGVWYSNDSYIPYTHWYSTVSYGKHSVHTADVSRWDETEERGHYSGTYYSSGREGYTGDPWDIPRSDRLHRDLRCDECGATGQVNRFMRLCEWCWACWICGDSADRPCRCESNPETVKLVDIPAREAFRAELMDSEMIDPPITAEPEIRMELSEAAKVATLRALTGHLALACADTTCCPEGA